MSRFAEPRLDGVRLWVDHLSCRDGEQMRPVAGVAQLSVNGWPEPLPLWGDVLRFRTHLHVPHGFHNPGAFDQERKAAADGVAWSGGVAGPEWIVVMRAGGGSLLRAIDQWRHSLLQRCLKIETPAVRGSVAALVVGTAGLLPPELSDHLRWLGIIHLYVISGLQIAWVAWGIYHLWYWLLSRSTRWALRYPLWRWAAALSLPMVWLYVAMVGAGVASIRAGIMVSVYLGALILDRAQHVGTALALAVALLLAQSPHLLFTPGFQLSCVAVLALVTVHPRVCTYFGVTTWPSRWRRWLAEAVIATIVAECATAPLVAYHFHQLPLLGFPANLIAGPYVTLLLMPLALAWMILAAVPVLGSLLLQGLILALQPLITAMQKISGAAEQSLWTVTPSVAVVCWCFLPLLLVILPVGRWRRGTAVLWTMVVVVLLAWPVLQQPPVAPLQLTFLDVGQGAAVLVEFPNGHTMLIDGGGIPQSKFDLGRFVLAPVLWTRGITQVNTVVLTHPHPDHYGGLPYIIDRFRPEVFISNGSVADERDVAWVFFQERLRAKNVPMHVMHQGSHIQVGDVSVHWRHPPASGPDERLGKNNGSLVADIQYGSFRALIGGDVEAEAEAQLVQDPDLGPVTVLQVPHHASRTSSTVAFLQKVQPKIAVAQLGFENRYGFPHAEVRERYRAMEIEFYRNDHHGAVTVSSDGQTYWVDTTSDFPTK